MVKTVCGLTLPRPPAQVWWCLVEEWDRALRVANKAPGTRYGYELAVTQFTEFLIGTDARQGSSWLDGGRWSEAAGDPAAVGQEHVEAFIAWMVRTRSATTAVAKFKGLQQFFTFLCDEGEITTHPMTGLRQPAVENTVVPALSEIELGALLATCRGTSFLDRRDTAVIRLLVDTDMRPSQLTVLHTGAVDLAHETVIITGKGDTRCALGVSAMTSQALRRYLRVRARHPAAHLPDLFLSQRGSSPLRTNAVKILLRRRGQSAGIPHMHAHRLRHAPTQAPPENTPAL